MLVLTLKEGEKIETNMEMDFLVQKINSKTVLIGLSAPNNVKFQRVGKNKANQTKKNNYYPWA